MGKIKWISGDYNRLYMEVNDQLLHTKMIEGLDGETVILIDGYPEEIVNAFAEDLCETTTVYFFNPHEKYYVVFTVDIFDGEGQEPHKCMYIHWRLKRAKA